MCLATITKRYETPDPSVRQAYKIMGRDGYSPFQRSKLTTEWREAISLLVSTGYSMRSECYLSGFHVFPTRKSARQALDFLKHTGGKISQGTFSSCLKPTEGVLAVKSLLGLYS